MSQGLLASRNIKAKPAHEYVAAREDVSLTDEMKEFIMNNGHVMNDLEMAKILFDDRTLTNLHKEVRVVAEFRKENNIQQSNIPAAALNNVPMEEYKPPRTMNLAVARINKYVLNGINKDKITSRQRAEIEGLINYIHTYRFLHQISNYENQIDRDLFESSFVRYTYNKSDLTQEEVDQYIVLASEVVIASNIQRRVEHLQGLLDDVAEDTDGRRISMSLVEAIGKAQNDYHQSVGRQNKLLSDLKEKDQTDLKIKLKKMLASSTLFKCGKKKNLATNLYSWPSYAKKLLKAKLIIFPLWTK